MSRRLIFAVATGSLLFVAILTARARPASSADSSRWQQTQPSALLQTSTSYCRKASFVTPRHGVDPTSQQRRHYQQERQRLHGKLQSPVAGVNDGNSGSSSEVEAIHEASSKADEEPGPVNSTSNSGRVVALTALSSYVALGAAAKVGILPGPYTDALIARDLGASLLCAVLGVAFVKTIISLASIDVLEPRDSRKIIHCLSAPLFMLFWPLFSDAGGARYFAAIVPLANAVRLVFAASGSQGEKELASAVSRSGDAKEAIGGPFFYVIVLLASVLTFWRDDLTGIVAVSTMAAGDGLADLIGRRFGKGNKWPFNQDKSVAGSVAFFVGASSCSVALALWFGYTGALTLPLELSDLAFRIVVISALSAVIELVPVVDDNWSVPLGAAILSAAFLH